MSKKKLPSEDSDLFRKTVGKVQAINNDKVLLSENNKPKPYPKSQTVDLEERMQTHTDFEIGNVGLEDSLSFTAPGLQHNVLKKLRKGQYGIDAEIDLHGLTGNEAKRQLLQFLHNSVQSGCRCVHIIHGKGYRSADQLPVLKNHLNLWLRQHKDVQAFCSASPKDGGTGALLVLLQLSEKYDR